MSPLVPAWLGRHGSVARLSMFGLTGPGSKQNAMRPLQGADSVWTAVARSAASIHRDRLRSHHGERSLWERPTSIVSPPPVLSPADLRVDLVAKERGSISLKGQRTTAQPSRTDHKDAGWMAIVRRRSKANFRSATRHPFG